MEMERDRARSSEQFVARTLLEWRVERDQHLQAARLLDERIADLLRVCSPVAEDV
jgi:hypothetical protein